MAHGHLSGIDPPSEPPRTVTRPRRSGRRRPELPGSRGGWRECGAGRKAYQWDAGPADRQLKHAGDVIGVQPHYVLSVNASLAPGQAGRQAVRSSF